MIIIFLIVGIMCESWCRFMKVGLVWLLVRCLMMVMVVGFGVLLCWL